jgi:hypothetical protein
MCKILQRYKQNANDSIIAGENQNNAQVETKCLDGIDWHRIGHSLDQYPGSALPCPELDDDGWEFGYSMAV